MVVERARRRWGKESCANFLCGSYFHHIATTWSRRHSTPERRSTARYGKCRRSTRDWSKLGQGRTVPYGKLLTMGAIQSWGVLSSTWQGNHTEGKKRVYCDLEMLYNLHQFLQCYKICQPRSLHLYESPIGTNTNKSNALCVGGYSVVANAWLFLPILVSVNMLRHNVEHSLCLNKWKHVLLMWIYYFDSAASAL